MKTRAKAYIAVVSIIGSLLGLKYILEYLLSVLCGETVVSLTLLLMPTIYLIIGKKNKNKMKTAVSEA